MPRVLIRRRLDEETSRSVLIGSRRNYVFLSNSFAFLKSRRFSVLKASFFTIFVQRFFILAVIYTVWGQIILQNIFGDKCDKQGGQKCRISRGNVDSKRGPENTNVVGAGNRAALPGSLL